MIPAASLVVERVIAADRPDIWSALIDPVQLSTWFTPCRRRTGRCYEIEFIEDGAAYIKTAVVLSCRPDGPEAEYSFRLEDPGSPDSEVQVQVGDRAVRGGTRVRIVHHRPPVDLVEGYLTGWADYLANLAGYLSQARPGAVVRGDR